MNLPSFNATLRFSYTYTFSLPYSFLFDRTKMIFEYIYHQSIPLGSSVLYILLAHPSCLLVEKWQPRQIYLVSLVKLLIEKENRKQILLRFLRKLTRSMRKMTM